MAKRDWKKPTDNTWLETANLGWLVAESHTETVFGVKGLNIYKGSQRLQYGPDEGVWLDLIQGWKEAGISWSHNSKLYSIVRSARVPYIIAPKANNKKSRYLDHLLVGYAETTDMVPVNKTSPWGQLRTGNDQHGDSRELGTFLVEDLWHDSVTPHSIENWWKKKSGEFIHGYELRDDYTNVSWAFRGVNHKVFGSVLISMANANGNVWHLLVGYEGGGGW